MKEEVNNEELNKEQWKLEAQAIINDVKQHVTDIKVSEKLRNNNQFFYLNLTTLEDLKFCIELSSAGFTIVGNEHDKISNRGSEHFETPYSLLNFVSPRYRDSFGNSLVHKLKLLSDDQ
ncbi:PREDICTED: GSK3-beta interaction protein [Eufriesea mexicana]|uniref:GSK3-beta interaction protein n=1 Tax=Eufriesea mexicana TaxID=516756 RepID=UPI00083C41E4|nr:PREDICTED: GSK3-beta interaction protein [Eufriesea mexicana]